MDSRAKPCELRQILGEPGARIMVLGPHPDDEVLATGGLLQQAIAAGAAVSVLLLTDGDNNPWPQRWLERRLSIGTAERIRWGQRRREEANAALTRLGVPTQVLSGLGWPDMGLTDLLLERPGELVLQLREAVQQFAPSLLVFPSLQDRHPDHNATHVLAQFMLAQMPAAQRPRTLCYLVHGSVDRRMRERQLSLGPAQVKAKREAMLAYVSQVALSRQRLLSRIGDRECYLEPVAEAGLGLPARSHGLPWKLPPGWFTGLELLVVDGERAWRLPAAADVHGPRLQRSGGATRLIMPDDTDASRPLYVKLRVRWRSAWIFDHWGWRALRPGPANGLTASAESSKLDPMVQPLAPDGRLQVARVGEGVG